MLKFAKVFMCSFLICLWAVSASASVTYHFEAPLGSDGPNGYFTFTSPDFITTTMTPAGEGQLGKVFNPSGVEQTLAVRFWPDAYNDHSFDVIGFGSYSQNLIWAYRFNYGAFSHYDSYSTTNWTAASLVVSESETVTAAPEPATMVLLGLGLVGLAGVRKKFKN